MTKVTTQQPKQLLNQSKTNMEVVATWQSISKKKTTNRRKSTGKKGNKISNKKEKEKEKPF